MKTAPVKNSLPVENVHLTGVDTNAIWKDGELGDRIAQRYITQLSRLQETGISCGVAHVTWGYERIGEPSAIGLKRFEEMANAAEKYKVKLALENSVYPQFLHAVLDALKSPYVGFCYDSGHENAFAPEENYLGKYGERLFAMHLHDNHGEKDEHNIPFFGSVNWEEKVKLLQKTKLFQEKICLEVSNYGEDIYAFLAKAYESLQQLFRL